MTAALAPATKIVRNTRACGLTDHVYVLLRMITGIMDVSNRYDDTKLSTYGAATHTLIVTLTDLFGHDKATTILSNVAWGVCETWFDDLLAAIEASNEGPTFDHDCDQCNYLGKHDGCDVYRCDKSDGRIELIKRSGNEGDEYSSMEVGMIKTIINMGCPTDWADVLPMLDS